MLRRSLIISILLAAVPCLAGDEPLPEIELAPVDTLATAHGPVVVQPFGHASLALTWRGRTILVDPVGAGRPYTRLPRPDLLLVTHRHGDHFDADLVRDLAGEHTIIVAPRDVAESIPAIDVVILANGDSTKVRDLAVRAVPAYNRTDGRLDFHPQGRDNGYVLDLDGFRIYISGDTEDIPEHSTLGSIDAAFLCMNLPWTMSGAQGLAAARAIQPAVLYPYHYRNGDGTFADLDALSRGLADLPTVEVRVLDWY